MVRVKKGRSGVRSKRTRKSDSDEEMLRLYHELGHPEFLHDLILSSSKKGVKNTNQKKINKNFPLEKLPPKLLNKVIEKTTRSSFGQLRMTSKFLANHIHQNRESFRLDEMAMLKIAGVNFERGVEFSVWLSDDCWEEDDEHRHKHDQAGFPVDWNDRWELLGASDDIVEVTIKNTTASELNDEIIPYLDKIVPNGCMKLDVVGLNKEHTSSLYKRFQPQIFYASGEKLEDIHVDAFMERWQKLDQSTSMEVLQLTCEIQPTGAEISEILFKDVNFTKLWDAEMHATSIVQDWRATEFDQELKEVYFVKRRKSRLHFGVYGILAVYEDRMLFETYHDQSDFVYNLHNKFFMYGGFFWYPKRKLRDEMIPY